MRQIHGPSSDAINLKRIQGGEEVAGDSSHGHRLPGADDEVRQQHHPAGGVTDGPGKDGGGVGDLSRSVRYRPNEVAVDKSDRQQHGAADYKSQDSSQRAA